ncbi:MAG TPA: hypothetical protein DCS15_07240 [Flavobacteriales bacterium]|jgi:phage tail-like protein|nr:phage tail protein [Salibacteraceae bacterium]HAS36265.1 hypothetical protein [Flavobacteriales bacterium]
MPELEEDQFVFPPLSFHFAVEVGEVGHLPEKDLLFTEATGFGMELEVDTSMVEAGNNNRVYVLPKRVKYTDLVLKRGIVSSDSKFYKWCEETINTNYAEPIKPQNITVNLLDESGEPLITWNFIDAFPKKMEVSALNAKASGEGAILIETITIAYSELTRGKKKS